MRSILLIVGVLLASVCQRHPAAALRPPTTTAAPPTTTAAPPPLPPVPSDHRRLPTIAVRGYRLRLHAGHLSALLLDELGIDHLQCTANLTLGQQARLRQAADQIAIAGTEVFRWCTLVSRPVYD